MMMMMFIGTENLVTQLENERSRVHATEVPATEPFHSQLSAIAFLFIQLFITTQAA